VGFEDRKSSSLASASALRLHDPEDDQKKEQHVLTGTVSVHEFLSGFP
jgi:hypothetical protein